MNDPAGEAALYERIDRILDEKGIPKPREARAARDEAHAAGAHAAGTFTDGCPSCETDHSRHAALDEYQVDTCDTCEAESAEADRKWEEGAKARRAAERKAERERAAWRRANPDAIAWRCDSCGVEFSDADADQDQGALYECSKLAEYACPECREGGLDELDPPIAS